MSKHTVHEEAKNAFLQQDAAEMADSAGARLAPGSSEIVLPYLSQVVKVDREGTVTPENSAFRLSQNEVTCILQYLAGASGLPPRSSWISFLELPDGAHHFVPFQKEAIEPLAKYFGDDLPSFSKRAQILGAVPLKMGDAGFRLRVLPKLDMALAVWEGDDEFPAKANVLFDAIAPRYLSTASLWVLGIEVVGRLTNEDRISYL